MSFTTRGLPIFLALVLCVYLLRNIHPSNYPSFKRNLQSTSTDTNPALLEDLCKDFVFNSSLNSSRTNLYTKLTGYLTKFRGGNRLINLVNSIAASNQPVEVVSRLLATAKDSQTELGSSYAWSMAVPMAFMCFFLLSSLICLVGFCCTSMNCCQKVCCCFFWANGERGKVPFFLLAALLLGGVVFMGALGMKTSDHIDEDSATVACTMSFIVNDIIKGNLTRGWLGLNTTADKMDYILTNATRLSNDITNVNTVNTNIQTLLGSVNDSNWNAYKTYAGQTLPRPDTSVAATYTPDFITVNKRILLLIITFP